MGSNAWDRAQEAIAHAHQRATERDEDVITPDTAVSPFDASSTTVLPHGLAARSGADPDLTQRIPQRNGHPRHRADDGATRNGNGRPRPGPDDPDDARTVRLDARERAHPGTSPFPANPFPGGPGPARGGAAEPDETPAAEPRRPWWRRLFGR
ncbi:hypothetical protein GCM10023200_33360 [Actinomycetospora chlora]|uniref:Uncharacterized protein n=1 Tax=Actinomycetospora chlora TaxID=663608 RepID=A0ABP9BHR0_9PSEU